MKVARGRIDAELKNALIDLIDGIKLDGASMGMGLRLLDEAMADVATRLSEIRRYTKKPLLAPSVVHPCSHVVLNRFDDSNPLCSATLCATTADLTRIVKENHELTTQANNMIEVLSGRARPPRGPCPRTRRARSRCARRTGRSSSRRTGSPNRHCMHRSVITAGLRLPDMP